MREITHEIELKRAAIRTCHDESSVNALLFELSQNVLNKFLNTTTPPPTQIPSLLKRPLLLTYAYLIDDQQQQNNNNNNNADIGINNCLKNLSSYEKNIASQLARIYTCVVNYMSNINVNNECFDETTCLSYNNTSYSVYDSTTTTTNHHHHHHHHQYATNTYNCNYNSGKLINELKMLHFLLILFNSYMHNDVDIIDIDNDLINEDDEEEVEFNAYFNNNNNNLDQDAKNKNLLLEDNVGVSVVGVAAAAAVASTSNVNNNNNNEDDDEFSFVNLQDIVDDVADVVVAAVVEESNTNKTTPTTLLHDTMRRQQQQQQQQQFINKKWSVDALECQKFIVKLIDRLLANYYSNQNRNATTTTTTSSSSSFVTTNSKLIKTKILLSIADLDI
jgi:hypothetical protein